VGQRPLALYHKEIARRARPGRAPDRAPGAPGPDPQSDDPPVRRALREL